MPISSTKIGLVGLIMALSSLTASRAIAANSITESAVKPESSTVEQKISEQNASEKSISIESRLTRISATLREREGQMPPSMAEEVERLHAGWVNGGGGGFANRAWRNGGWADGGGFFNNRGGGGFANNRGGGGFANVR